MVNILIPAAGLSSRMRGADKLLQIVDGIPLLRRQCLRAMATGCPVFVAIPAFDHPRAGALTDIGVTLLEAPDSPEGLSATLRNAVAQIGEGGDLLIALPDLVDLDSADLKTVIASRKTAPECVIWRGATSDGKPGHPILFHKSLLAEFATLSGDDGASSVVRANKTRCHIVPLENNRARYDLDTPEEWDAYQSKH